MGNSTDATIIPRELNSFAFNAADWEDVPRPVGWLPASKRPPHSADALLKANIKDGPCVGRRYWKQDYCDDKKLVATRSRSGFMLDCGASEKKHPSTGQNWRDRA